MNPTVDLFEIDLVDVAQQAPDLDALLPPHERDAPASSRVVRAVTRRILGSRLGLDPARVPVTRVCERCGHPTHGRPRLDAVGGSAFGATHSDDRAIVAFADSVPTLGIDLEAIRARGDLERLAGRVLDRETLAGWRSGDPATALERFLVAWTAKEAYLKGIGVGIAADLRSVPPRPDGWWIGAAPSPSGYVASLAVPGGPVGIRRHPAGTVEL